MLYIHTYAVWYDHRYCILTRTPQGGTHPVAPQFADDAIKFFSEEDRIAGLKFAFELNNSEILAPAVNEQSLVSEQRLPHIPTLLCLLHLKTPAIPPPGLISTTPPLY